MQYFDGVIVVEGKGDVSFLSSFICSEYVVLNGYDIPEDVVDYLLHIKNRRIIVLTDPDEAGEEIEKRVKSTGLVYERKIVKPECCNKHGKHGVAECTKEEILRVFSNDLVSENPFKISFTKEMFIKNMLTESSFRRGVVASAFHLGNCNCKTLFKRINYNRISSEDIEKLWK